MAGDAVSGRPPGGPPEQPISIRVLGGFEVHEGNRHRPVPAGLPAQAVKFVVAEGGRVHSEVLMDTLWPTSSPEEGRKGVRNVLSRLGRAGSPLLVREGDALRVGDRISIDALAFRAAADRVLMDAGSPGAPEGARFALARYRGELLPDDRYSDWAEAARQRLRRRQVALLDLLAADARRRGALLEAVHLLELAIEADPIDDVRYLEAADLLLAAGRRGRAAELVERSRHVLLDHDLLPGAAWDRLQRQLREVHRSPQEVGATEHR